MILGLSLESFTTLHVVISLIAILSGLVVFGAMLQDRWLSTLNQIFIFSTIATSASGFLFPSAAFGPPHVIGVISLVVLAFAAFALNAKRLLGRWLPIYTVSALTALYLNVFVAVVQAFQKVPSLHAVAPTQAAPAFIGAQILLLVVACAVGVLAVKRLRSDVVFFSN